VASSDPKSAPDSSPSAQGALIFMSDASAEAERLSLALRSRGHWVVDVPLGLLAGRVSVQRPAVVVCDADAPGTLETITRVHMVAGDRAIQVLLLAERTESPTDTRREVEKLSGGLFARPVDAEALIDRVEQIVGPAGSRPSASGFPQPSGRSPVLMAATRRPYRYEGPRPGSRAPMSAPPSGQPSAPPSGPSGGASAHPSSPVASSPSSAPSVAPSSAGRPSTVPPAHGARAAASVAPLGIGAVPHAKLSPELEMLLGRAEQRVRHANAAGPSIPAAAERLSPDAEVEAVLPADLLAALDEPLQDDDEDDDDDSAHGTAGGSETGSPGTRGTPEQGTATGGSRAAPGRTETNSTAQKPPPAKMERAETAAEAPERSSTFGQEPPTAPPRAPALPPPSMRSTTALDGPEPLVESRPTRPPPTLAQSASEHLPPLDPLSTRPPRSQMDDRPGEVTSAARAAPPPPLSPRPEPVDLPLEPPPGKHRLPDVPVVLGAGDGVRALARSIAARFTGAIAFEDQTGIRRVVFRDGDFVTAASSAEGESLVGFLAQRGDLSAEVAQRVARRLPPFGRHAGAALVAQGHLRQDELWSVLRAHAEWLLGRVASLSRGGASLEHEVPQRLQAEPGVFGGATGAEVLIETVRRVVPPADAVARLGGRGVRLGFGSARSLLGECALPDAESTLVNQAEGVSLEELLLRSGGEDFAAVVWTLVELGVLRADATAGRVRLEPAPKPSEWDPLDADAVRARIAARLALVEEGDYFALLGVARDATNYDLRRAYTALRKAFDPGAVLTAATVDLKDDVDSILEVIEEAYDVLRDPVRRERYRRALEAAPR
jgi:hypothetical protein